MRRILIIILAACVFSTSANDMAHEQILVFRNSGEVNLFYSDEIKSIECCKVDSSGIIHEDVVCQRFILQDTTIVIPINEIDSVAFGERNQIIPKADARKILNAETKYLIRYDGENLYYSTATPSHILPRVNEKLYYNDFSELFPTGLCARVVSVSPIGGEIKVVLEDLSPNEVFDAYFFAGEVGGFVAPETRAQSLEDTFKFNVPLEQDNISITSSGGIGMKIKLVSNPLIRYYHADLVLSAATGIEMNLKSDDSDELNFESTPWTLFVGTIGGVLQPRLQVAGFIDFAAEMGLSYNMTRSYSVTFSWTKRGDNIVVEGPLYNQNNEEENSANIEAYLKGKLHFGVKAMLTLGVLFDHIGTGIDFKIGPEFRADFNLGMLNDLSKEFNPEIYAKAHLEMDVIKLKIETYTYNAKNFYLWGEKVKHPLKFTVDMSFLTRTLNLFPDFSSKAVKAEATPKVGVPTEPTEAITVASKSDTDIEYPLEMGFELTDTITETVLSQILIDEIIEAKSDSLQGFDTEFPLVENLADIKTDNVVASPVFKYRDYVIKGAPANVMDDIFYSPIITVMTNRGNYIVSGQQVIGSDTFEERCFIQGNLMPIPGNTKPYKRTYTIVTGIFLENGSVVGVWGSDDIDLKFNDDNTGIYNGEKFTYEINTPQTGDVRMMFSNNRYLIFTIIELTDSEIKIIFKQSDKIITLRK